MADYGHDLQFGFFLDPSTGNPARTLEIARILDDLGYDLIGVQDHPYQQKHFDAMALMAYILGQTERVRVFPDVANLPLRPPLMLAKEAATLDQLSGGRFELGLGAGAFWDAIRAMGGPVRAPREAMAALREAIGLIRAFWSGQIAAPRRRVLPGDGCAAGSDPRPRHRHLAGRHRAAGAAPDRRAGRRLDSLHGLRPASSGRQVERHHRRGSPRCRARPGGDPAHLQHRRRRGAGHRGRTERRRPADRGTAGALGQGLDASGGRSGVLDLRALGRADRAAAAHVHRGDRAGGAGAGGGSAASRG